MKRIVPPPSLIRLYLALLLVGCLLSACGDSPSGPLIRIGAKQFAEQQILAEMYAMVRTLRIADGPDEVHNRTVARLEYAKHGGRGG